MGLNSPDSKTLFLICLNVNLRSQPFSIVIKTKIFSSFSKLSNYVAKIQEGILMGFIQLSTSVLSLSRPFYLFVCLFVCLVENPALGLLGTAE